MEEDRNLSQRSNQQHKKIIIQSIALSIFACIVCFYIFEGRPIIESEQGDILQKQEQYKNKLNQESYLETTNSFQDTEWKEQQIKYSFKCVHGLISKNYEPFVINKPGEDHKQQYAQRSDQQSKTKKHSSHKLMREKDILKEAKIVQDENIISPQKVRSFRRSEEQTASDTIPIQISLDYSNFQVNNSNKEKLTYIQQTLIPEMINTMRSIISIQAHVTMKVQSSSQSFEAKSNQEENNSSQSSDTLFKQIKHDSFAAYNRQIYIPYGQCFKTKVPSLHSTVGVNTDIILYITNTKEPISAAGANLSGQQLSSLIWGVVCVRDFQDNHRPVAAQLNINDELLNHTSNHQYNYNVLIHEMIHILGFSRNSLELATKSQTFIKQSPLDSSKQILALDSLRNYAQTYYNCTDSKQFQGVEIEDEEEDQTSLHFEKRYLMNDIMTADISVNSMFSPLTLKVLESTGWYKINYNVSLQYQYLLLSGCPILYNFTSYYNNQTSQLNESIPTPPLPPQPPTPPISTNSSNSTTQSLNKQDSKESNGKQPYLKKSISHRSRQIKLQNNTLSNTLNITKQTLNSYYNNIQNFCNSTTFNQEQRGCSYDFKYKSACYASSLSNGYSYLQPLENGSCIDSVKNQHIEFQNVTGEIFSDSSYCFISNIKQNQTNAKNNIVIDSTRCYSANCNEDLKQIEVSLFNNTLVCTEDYQIISNPFGLNGQFNCPNITQFCVSHSLRNYNPNQ